MSGAARGAVVLDPGDPERERCERELVTRGVPLSLTHRIVWSRTHPRVPTLFIAVRDGGGAYVYGFGVQAYRSRALPGHLLLLAERVDPTHDLDAAVAALRCLAELARRRRRVLRLRVELFSEDAALRGRAAATLRELGFAHAKDYLASRNTLLLDLAADEDALFAGLHANARRKIRTVARAPVEVRAITERAFAGRLDELVRETLARTGGTYAPTDWSAALELSREAPELSRIVGLFRADAREPDALLAFAWGCMHGTYGHYFVGGSTRRTDLRVPMGYGLIWDLALWAKRSGARYFDLGGITKGSEDGAERMGGIAEFKRFFNARAAEVGEEWILEPRATRAKIATAVSAAVALARRVSTRRRA